MLAMEILKLRRSLIWLPLVLLPSLSILFGTGNYLGNRGVLQQEWISLFTQVYFFYGLLFLPALVGLIVSFIWYNEHKKNALKLMLISRTSPFQMMLEKNLVALGLVLVAQVLLFSLYGVVGSFLGFETGLPWFLLGYALATTIFILPLMAVQSYLSLRLTSFALPVALAAGLGFVGLLMTGQSVLPELSYVFAFSKMTVLLNHIDGAGLGLSFLEWGKLVGYSLLITGIFTILQLCYFAKLKKG